MDIENPPHYRHHKITDVDVMEDWNLPTHLGVAIRYFHRYRYKGNPRADLEKHIWWVRRYLDVTTFEGEK